MKVDRHSKILEILDRYEVETQEDLTRLLRQEGINVTQATVSRDIRQMKLVKVMTGNGKFPSLIIPQTSMTESSRFSGKRFLP